MTLSPAPHLSHYKCVILAEFSSLRTLTAQNINVVVFFAMKRVPDLSVTKTNGADGQ